MKEPSIRKRILWDKLFKGTIVLLTFCSILPMFFILFFITSKGISVINWRFLTQLPKPVGELGGGISNGIIGTFILIVISVSLFRPYWHPCRDLPFRKQERKAGIPYKIVCRDTPGDSFHCHRNHCIYLAGCFDGIILSALRRSGSRSDDAAGHYHCDRGDLETYSGKLKRSIPGLGGLLPQDDSESDPASRRKRHRDRNPLEHSEGRRRDSAPSLYCLRESLHEPQYPETR